MTRFVSDGQGTVWDLERVEDRADLRRLQKSQDLRASRNVGLALLLALGAVLLSRIVGL